MNGICYKFFACTAFPGDHNCRVGLRNPPDNAVKVLHGGGLTDEPVHPLFLDLGSQEDIFLFEVLQFDRAFQGKQDFVHIGRLGEIVVGAAFHGLDSGFHRTMAGQNDYQSFRKVGCKMFQDAHSTNAGH